jgi:DNA-binding transcriptional ArsR family regulator
MSRARSSAPADASAARGALADSLPVFAALADETRLRLVSRLCEEGPSSIAQLTSGSEVTRQAISKHLRLMEEAGLLRARRQGRESVWELEPRRLDAVRRCLDEISAQWDGALGRLKAFVES